MGPPSRDGRGVSHGLTLKGRSPHKYQAGSLLPTGYKAMYTANIQGAAFRVQRELNCRYDFASMDGEGQGWGAAPRHSERLVLTLLWFENPAHPSPSPPLRRVLLGNLQVRELTLDSPGYPFPSLCHLDCPFVIVVLVSLLGTVSLRKTLLGAGRSKTID